MIRVKNVSKKYGSFKAVDHLSFEIEDGEIVGLLGPNGAGKSTTMNMLTGYIEPTEGEIIIDDVDILKKPKKVKKQIGYMPENVPLYKDMTPREFVSYLAELRKVPRKVRKDEVDKVPSETGIIEVSNKLIRNLSRGYKQRVSLAGALVGNPKILILDEPTVGLDPKQISEIRTLIKSLGKKHTLIISSHILSEISQLCEKVIIMKEGKMIAIDTPDHLEEKVQKDHSVVVTVEDPENLIASIKEDFSSIKEISLMKENDDHTKQYLISSNDKEDLRKIIFSYCAKKGITIFELSKSQVTLEDAFLNILSEEDQNDESERREN